MSIRAVPTPPASPHVETEGDQASAAPAGFRAWLPGPVKTAARLSRRAAERVLQRVLTEQRTVNAALRSALTSLQRDWELEGHRMRVRLDGTERRLDATERRMDRMERAGNELGVAVQRLSEQLTRELAAMGAAQTRELEGAVQPLKAQLERIRWQLLDIEGRSAAAASARTSGAAPSSAAPQSSAELQANAALEQLFVSGFSERFRGTREEVKENVRWYADLLAKAGAGTPARPIVDLGCGRGELLEVLREKGLVVRGVEYASTMVTQCRDLGFEVDEGDALSYLASVSEGSLGALTAIHVAEHLKFTDLLAFFKLARRALVPGGMLVLETPNPDNLRVGARNFHLDPTHVKPLVPDLLQFVADSLGFTEAKVHPLHPGGALFHAEGPAAQLAKQLNDVICGPQDYALTALRP